MGDYSRKLPARIARREDAPAAPPAKVVVLHRDEAVARINRESRIAVTTARDIYAADAVENHDERIARKITAMVFAENARGTPWKELADVQIHAEVLRAKAADKTAPRTASLLEKAEATLVVALLARLSSASPAHGNKITEAREVIEDLQLVFPRLRRGLTLDDFGQLMFPPKGRKAAGDPERLAQALNSRRKAFIGSAAEDKLGRDAVAYYRMMRRIMEQQLAVAPWEAVYQDYLEYAATIAAEIVNMRGPD